MRALLGVLAAALVAGALTSCGNATLTEYAPSAGPTANPYGWKEAVVPIFTARDCNSTACHSVTNYQNSGDLRLDPKGISDDQLYVLVVSSGGVLQQGGLGREADTANPTESLLLQKPTQQINHNGGHLFDAGSPDYETILHWVENGAKDD